MNRKITKNMSVTEQIKIVQGMMNNMNAVDRQIMSDKLLSFLLFDSSQKDSDRKFSADNSNENKHSGLSEEELKLIKELAKKTADLRNLLGDDPNLFS